MRSKAKKHSMDTLFTFLLLLVFALFSLLLTAMGSAVYRSGVKHLNENYTSRTAIAYVSEKVRQHDGAGDIFLTEVEEIPAIGFRDEIENNAFITYVYYWEGALRELFIRADNTPLAAMGNSIVELESFEIALPDKASENTANLLRVTASGHDGDQLFVLIHPSSSQ